MKVFASIPSPNNRLGKIITIPRIVPLRDFFVAKIQKLLAIFSGAAGLVFLIGCANFANLLLIRNNGRQAEISLRASLGATRFRLVRQLITESLVLAFCGTSFGLLLSFTGVHALAALLPAASIPPGAEMRPDSHVLLFTVGLSIATGLLVAMLPALKATRTDLRRSLDERNRSASARRNAWRGGLVTVEIALTMILLGGAGLLVKSFLQLRSVDPGFHAENLAVATVDLPHVRYQTAAQMQAFDTSVLTALAVIPGAEPAAAVSFLPFGHGVAGDFHLENGRGLPEGYRVDKPQISPNYFEVMGIRLIKGRAFTNNDVLSAPGVAIVSESVAQRFWPAGDAVGKRISMADNPKSSDWLTIVGIAANVRQQGLTDRDAAVIYQPYQQIRMPGFIASMSFVMKSSSVAAAAANMRRVIRRIDANVPVETVFDMAAIIDNSLASSRSQMRLLSVFSVLALLLAGIGIYGVIAYSVAERSHEIGIRMAVGASRADVVFMVLHRTLLYTGGGVLIGLAGAFWLMHFLESLVFEVKTSDPLTFTVVIFVIVAVAAIASLAPATRAARVDPMEALRNE